MARDFRAAQISVIRRVETALGDESPVRRQQHAVHRAARFTDILVDCSAREISCADAAAPADRGLSRLLFIERRPLTASTEVPERDSSRMRPSRLDQTVVENRGEIERAFQYNAVGLHRNKKVVNSTIIEKGRLRTHRSRKRSEQHDLSCRSSATAAHFRHSAIASEGFAAEGIRPGFTLCSRRANEESAAIAEDCDGLVAVPRV